jgi:hypothetical protein
LQQELVLGKGGASPFCGPTDIRKSLAHMMTYVMGDPVYQSVIAIQIEVKLHVFPISCIELVFGVADCASMTLFDDPAA